MLDSLVPIIVLCVVIVFISSLWVWDKIRFDRRERDFLNRFMARNFLEYTDGMRKLEQKPSVEAGISELMTELAEDQEEVVRVR